MDLSGGSHIQQFNPQPLVHDSFPSSPSLSGYPRTPWSPSTLRAFGRSTRAHGAADPAGRHCEGARSGGSGGAASADGIAGGERSTPGTTTLAVKLAVGGDEQRHQCGGEVCGCEEPPLSKKFASSPFLF